MQVIKAYGGRRGIPLYSHILNLSKRQRGAISCRPRLLTAGAHWRGGWVGPRIVLFNLPFLVYHYHEWNIYAYQQVRKIWTTYRLYFSNFNFITLHMCFSFHLRTFKTSTYKTDLTCIGIYTQEMQKIATVNDQQARTVYNFKDIRRDYSSACQVGFISWLLYYA